MASRKLWGELEEEEPDETVLQNVNFNPIIELAMQNIPEIPITVKSSPIELPKPNLITHTVQLQAHAAQLKGIIHQAETAMFEGAALDHTSIPQLPPEPPNDSEHKHIIKTPINFLEQEYCNFSLGKGPIILPFTPESHQKVLKQCAAIALGQVGVLTSTNTALNTLADALDVYMTTMCKLMRTVTDKEASGLRSGFPDVVSKVFTELDIKNLHEFYENRVVKYHSKILNQCMQLRGKCETIVSGEMAPQLKLEEVPELHFPAALDGAFTPSLEPGFQMLQSLEQDQLQGLELLDAVTDEVKMEAVDYMAAESSNMHSFSPGAKKKRK